MSASKYARVVPVLRTLKGRIVGPDRVRELAATASVDDVLAGIRETLYASAAEARIPEKVVQAMFNSYWSIVVRVAELVPPEARPLALAFVRVDEVADAVTITYRVVRGEGVWGSYLTASLRNSFTSRILAEPELASSPQRILESAPEWIEPILEDALNAYNASRDPMVLAYYRPLARARVFYDSLRGLGRRDRVKVLRVICPLQRSEAAAAALEAVSAGVQGRSLEVAWRTMAEDPCGVDWRGLAEVVSREGDVSTVTAYLKQAMPDVLAEGRTPLEQAANVRARGRREARRRAEGAFMGYPFHAGLVAAGLLLARLEYEDLKSILLATKYKVHPGEYAGILSRVGVA